MVYSEAKPVRTEKVGPSNDFYRTLRQYATRSNYLARSTCCCQLQRQHQLWKSFTPTSIPRDIHAEGRQATHYPPGIVHEPRLFDVYPWSRLW